MQVLYSYDIFDKYCVAYITTTFQGVSAEGLVCWTAVCGLVVSLAVLPATLGSSLLSPAIASLGPQDWAAMLGLAFCGLAAFASMTIALKLVRKNHCIAFIRTLL